MGLVGRSSGSRQQTGGRGRAASGKCPGTRPAGGGGAGAGRGIVRREEQAQLPDTPTRRRGTALVSGAHCPPITEEHVTPREHWERPCERREAVRAGLPPAGSQALPLCPLTPPPGLLSLSPAAPVRGSEPAGECPSMIGQLGTRVRPGWQPRAGAFTPRQSLGVAGGRWGLPGRGQRWGGGGAGRER